MTMMKLAKTLGAVFFTTAMLVALPACQKQEGPAERAGKAVDKAVDQAGSKIEEAGKSIQDAANDAKK